MTPATDPAAGGAAARIVGAEPSHLEAIQAAYAHYVLTTTSTFDVEPPTLAAWQLRLADLLPVDEFLVATDGGSVLGFAYSGSYRPKAAYASTRETSVYTVPGHAGRGLGLALYTELLRRLDAKPAVRLTVANLAEPNPASTALHRRCGFEPVGTLVGVGLKFGQARDVTLWQRPSRSAPPLP